MTKAPKAGKHTADELRIDSVDGFLARAYAMEVEAAERYEEFAAQMEVHGNLDVANLFNELAGFERKHADSIAADLATRGVAAAPRVAFAKPGQEGVETAAGDDLHYLMTPYQALQIALANEQRAIDFFAELAASGAPDDIRRLATEFADDEKMHVELVQNWLTRLPKPSEDWSYDPDEPQTPE